MAAVALNLLALLIVLGLCWAAMMWLSGRFHGVLAHSLDDELQRRGRGPEPVSGSSIEETCAACEGVGANNTRGRLEPCPQCHGTGVFS